MNRNDEFIELKQELEQTPVELEYIATKAMTRAKKQKRRSLIWKTPVISFCSTIILFVLLVNLFPKVALAMSNVPILKNLVAAVALDPSLKRAVENDYYQVIGESQTQDDVTVNVEYMILDAHYISLFFSVDAPVKAGTWHYDFTDSGKRAFPAAIEFDTLYEVGKLEELKINFTDSEEIPEEIVFTVTINKNEQLQYKNGFTLEEAVADSSNLPTPAAEVKNTGIDYTFRFVLHPDKAFTQIVKSYPINQQLEIKGQKIYLEKLDIYPTHARLFLDSDKNNSAFVNHLDISLKDDKGKIYTSRGGFGSSDSESFEISTIFFDSTYFTKAKKLTLSIKGIEMMDKEKLYGEINFASKTIKNLPEGVSVDSMELTNSTLKLTLKTRFDKPKTSIGDLFFSYYDVNGNEYYFGTWTASFIGEDEYTCYYNYEIKNYEDNKYKIKWNYSPMKELEEPIKVIIK